MRIRDKKRFALFWACLMLIILGIFAIGIALKHSNIFYQNTKKTVSSVNNKKPEYVKIPVSSDGSISVTENSVYKKYVISCTKDFDTVKYDESNGLVSVYFTSGEINKVSLNSSSEDKNVFIKKNKKEEILMFQTNYSKNNKVYVEQRNKKSIDVLISKVEEPMSYKVVIDAGHGGTDPGTFIGELYEKNITLSIAKYMQEYLIYQGCNVTYTREKDELLVPGRTNDSIKQDLRARADVANKINADAFVSIHINNNALSSCKGVTTFCYSPNGYQKNERKAFAEAIQKNALKSDSWYDMKIRSDDNLSVLVHTTMPSVLVECGFLTNPEDREKLTKNEVLENFAENISNGIGEFLNSDLFKEYKKTRDASK